MWVQSGDRSVNSPLAVTAGGNQPSFDFDQPALAALDAPQMVAESAEPIAHEIVRIVGVLAQVFEGASRNRRSLDIEQFGPRIGCRPFNGIAYDNCSQGAER